MNLYNEHFSENKAGNDELEIVENCEENPDEIVITTFDTKQAQIQQISEKRREVYAAKKLLLVTVGFLFCWLPYFLWLPVSTLLVNIF